MAEGTRFDMATEGSVAERLSLGASKVASESSSESGEVVVVVVMAVDSGMGFAEGEQCKEVVGMAIDLGIP